MSGPPIRAGALRVIADRIEAVGFSRDLTPVAGEGIVDLGESIVLPGLVNAHCHLDYTDMAGLVLPPRSFRDWIQAVFALKAEWGYSDYAQSWLRGASMLLRNGVTTVADIEAVPELLPEVWTATPLRVHSFLELTGVKNRRPAEDLLREAVQRIEALPAGRCRCGVSPHALYSTLPSLMSRLSELGRAKHWILTTHLAESAEEFDMFRHARGPLYDWLKPQRLAADCGFATPAQLLESHGLLQTNLLAVHANYLAKGDAQRLASGAVTVVHCPRSHQYFNHRPFPFEELAAAGVHIAFGTDSLITVRGNLGEQLELDLFSEMRLFANQHPGVAPRQIIEMATVRAARALGRAGELGELRPGALADLIVLPWMGNGADPCEELLRHRGPVLGSMIGGHWAVTPPAASSWKT